MKALDYVIQPKDNLTEQTPLCCHKLTLSSGYNIPMSLTYSAVL